MSSMFGQNVSTRILILKRHRAIQFGSVKAYLKGKGLTSGWRASLQIKKRFCFSLQTPLISFDGQELPVSLKLKNFNFRWKRSILVWTERQFVEIPLLETLLILPNPSFKKNFSHLVESENDWTLIYIHPKIENYPATSDATRAG